MKKSKKKSKQDGDLVWEVMQSPGRVLLLLLSNQTKPNHGGPGFLPAQKVERCSTAATKQI